MLPARLKPETDPDATAKRCSVCGDTFTKPLNYSIQQWRDKVFCSNRCSQYIPLSERLYDSIEKDAVTGCWNWTGHLRRGYGYIVRRWDGYTTHLSAHRAAYATWVGPIPEGLMILHSCDNPRCINPAHLRPGTHQENMDDKTARARHRNQYGRPGSRVAAEA
jgi:hypothetical protein